MDVRNRQIDPATVRPGAAAGETIAVLGLGYVGLPLLAAMARAHGRALGFDVDRRRVEALMRGHDETGEVAAGDLRSGGVALSHDASALAGATCFIICVPTPLNEDHQPDLSMVVAAGRTVAAHLRTGALVVLESTVYPGVTEDVLGAILAEASGLRPGIDFHLGYSPERINPGDREHRLDTVVKIISADGPEALQRMERVYGPICGAGPHRASCIKVAEAANVIENTQRDLNIALMNECAIIFDRLGLRTSEVLRAAGTKWNFLPFTPGLVGGHCIGVDPFYLTAVAQRVGYHPEVILAGRRINDRMPSFIVAKLIKMLMAKGSPMNGLRVALLGVTFKENVPDTRNSRAMDVVRELQEYGVTVLAHDPIADADAVAEEYGIGLVRIDEIRDVDAVILAVAHRDYRDALAGDVARILSEAKVVIDVKSVLDPALLQEGASYWSL